ncbi:MAG: hypothetical protein WCG25_00595 [bacterium]
MYGIHHKTHIHFSNAIHHVLFDQLCVIKFICLPIIYFQPSQLDVLQLAILYSGLLPYVRYITVSSQSVFVVLFESHIFIVEFTHKIF